jgi:hypothetical protein
VLHIDLDVDEKDLAIISVEYGELVREMQRTHKSIKTFHDIMTGTKNDPN